MKYLVVLHFFVATFYLNPVQAQTAWELKKNENGIAVYSRKSTGSQLNEIRVVCTFNTTLDKLVAVLQDVENHKDWVYSTRKSNLVKKLNAQTLVYYTESDMPWPVSDRDLVVELSVNSVAEQGLYIIQAKSIPDYLPRKTNLVRVPYSLAYWKITPDADKLKIDYTFTINPGGAVPAWLVNSTAVIGPYNSFVKLRALLESKAKK